MSHVTCESTALVRRVRLWRCGAHGHAHVEPSTGTAGLFRSISQLRIASGVFCTAVVHGSYFRWQAVLMVGVPFICFLLCRPTWASTSHLHACSTRTAAETRKHNIQTQPTTVPARRRQTTNRRCQWPQDRTPLRPLLQRCLCRSHHHQPNQRPRYPRRWLGHQHHQSR